jgi:hypothetical protein
MVNISISDLENGDIDVLGPIDHSKFCARREGEPIYREYR